MKPIKITLIGLIALLTVAVVYGYGCGGGDETKGGNDATTTAAPADDGSGDQPDDGGDDDGGDEKRDGDQQADTTSDGGGGDGAPLSKAAFVKQGDAICQTVPTTYGELLAELEEERKKKGEGKASQAEGNLAAAVPPLHTAVEEFEALTPPNGDEAKAEAIIEALEAAAEGVEAKPTSELSGPKSPFAEFQKLTSEYGFTVCSQL